MASEGYLTRRITESLKARQETEQWYRLITALLHRLELKPSDRTEAVNQYDQLTQHLADKLEIDRHDVHIFPQGSMRTQTTIAQRYPVKFDIDIVVRLSGTRYESLGPKAFFEAFGKALEGREYITGEPDPKRRCWRLDYPGKRFYFDVTPAVPDRTGFTGSELSVHDPDTGWSPSNPDAFAEWFCERAELRFTFAMNVMKSLDEARSQVTPVPEEPVGIDDILRRALQLMKLHRDMMYWNEDPDRKAAAPISVILVTLATRAYENLIAKQQNGFASPLEAVLALIDDMPDYLDHDGCGWRVENPTLVDENFADRWNNDNGVRYREFTRWYGRLQDDLEALFEQSHSAPDEDRIRRVFGQAGVEAWKESRPRENGYTGLLGGLAAHASGNPDQPIKTGSKSTLG